jgi:hypothetical protein
MKAFTLAVAAAAGLLCSAGTADAQFRSRGSYRSVAPTYVAPAYGYGYSAPSYYSSYSPYTSSGVVVTSGYTPAYTPTVYPSGYSYNPSAWAPTYGSSYYGSYPTYGSYYNSGVNVTPSGAYIGGRRAIRW